MAARSRIEMPINRARSFLILAAVALPVGAPGQEVTRADLDGRFTRTVQPFLRTYCITCHGKDRPKAEMDLSAYQTMAALLQDGRRWSQVLERLEAEEMPPLEAKRHPSAKERREAIEWFHEVREQVIQRNAGDPGIVLARRLSNTEYNYTIRDLTGVDIRPTREFPVDPANTAGFDNSGESLSMSPALLNKYLKAARTVGDHMEIGRASCKERGDVETNDGH